MHVLICCFNIYILVTVFHTRAFPEAARNSKPRACRVNYTSWKCTNPSLRMTRWGPHGGTDVPRGGGATAARAPVPALELDVDTLYPRPQVTRFLSAVVRLSKSRGGLAGFHCFRGSEGRDPGSHLPWAALSCPAAGARTPREDFGRRTRSFTINTTAQPTLNWENSICVFKILVTSCS